MTRKTVTKRSQERRGFGEGRHCERPRLWEDAIGRDWEWSLGFAMKKVSGALGRSRAGGVGGSRRWGGPQSLDKVPEAQSWGEEGQGKDRVLHCFLSGEIGFEGK